MKSDTITLAHVETLGFVHDPESPGLLIRASDLSVSTANIPDFPPYDAELYAALKRDITKRGILIPLVFDTRTKEIVDGRVRLQIAHELKLKQIPMVVVSFTEGEARDVRLILNGLRRQLTRAQLATLISWTLRKNPTLSDREVAREVGVDNKTVASARKRLVAGEEIPQLEKHKGRDGKLYAARRPSVIALSEAQANEATRALNSLGNAAPRGISPLRKIRRLARQQQRENRLKGSGPTLPEHFDVRCCDFRTLDLEDEIVDLMILDPPWQTEKNLREQFAATTYRLLKPGGYALIYTGHSGLLDFGDVFRDAGLTYRWLITCINHDSAGSIKSYGTVYVMNRLVSVYQKGGKFRTPSLVKDVLITEDREKPYHEWQQPLSESVEFVRTFTSPGEFVVDLTSGTFTVGEAVARVSGGRRFLGCEIRPELVEVGKKRIAAALDFYDRPCEASASTVSNGEDYSKLVREE